MAFADRQQLFETLNNLTPQELGKLLFAIKPPAGIVPPQVAPQGDRVAALLQWAESTTGRGLNDIQNLPEPASYSALP